MRTIFETAATILALSFLSAPGWCEPVRITGRLDPAAASGARVELHALTGPPGAIATARPAADGSFALTAPETGFYKVVVRSAGRPALEARLAPLVDAAELPPVRPGAAGAAGRFTGWAPADEGTLAASTAPQRTGRVLDAFTRQPVAGALVWQEVPGVSFSWTRADAEGRFQIPAEAARPIAAAAPGYARAVRPEVPPDAPVSIALKPAVALAGRVVDAAGKPVAGAEVQALPGDPYPYRRGLRDQAVDWTREDGTFRLRGVPARAMIRVEAGASGFAPASTLAGTGEPGQTPAPLRLVLAPGATLTGRIVGEDGRPVAGAEVLLQDLAALDAGLDSAAEERRAVTDATGSFRFEHLSGGGRDLRVERAGFAPLRREVEIPDRPGTLDLDALRLASASAASLERKAAERMETGRGFSPWFQSAVAGRPRMPGPVFAVSGRVADAKGAPVAGARVLLQTRASGDLFQTTTDNDGSFAVPDVPEGAYHLRATAEGFSNARLPEEVRVAGGPVADLALRLEPGGVIAGRILGLAEHELHRVQVTAHREGKSFDILLRDLADTEGRYRITGVPLGEWRVVARRSAAYLAEGTVRLDAQGDEAVLDLHFPEGVAVAGRVLVDGKPLAGAMVALGNPETDGRQARQTSTRADGSFALSAVGPGSYRLLVLAGGVKHVRQVEIPRQGELVIELAGGS